MKTNLDPNLLVTSFLADLTPVTDLGSQPLIVHGKGNEDMRITTATESGSQPLVVRPDGEIVGNDGSKPITEVNETFITVYV